MSFVHYGFSISPPTPPRVTCNQRQALCKHIAVLLRNCLRRWYMQESIPQRIVMHNLLQRYSFHHKKKFHKLFLYLIPCSSSLPLSFFLRTTQRTRSDSPPAPHPASVFRFQDHLKSRGKTKTHHKEKQHRLKALKPLRPSLFWWYRG